MNSSRWRSPWLPLAAAVLCILFPFSASAATDKPKPAPKPAAPAKTTPAAKPSSGGAAAGHSGTAGTASHSGPTTSGHTGPTTSGSHSPTTSNPSGHTTTTTGSHTTAEHTTTAGHTTTTGPGHGTEGGVHNTSAHSTTPRTATGKPAPTGAKTVQAKSGSAVTKRANGKVSDVHDAKRNMDIHHNLNGGRKVSVERADHSRVVGERGRRGYVERRYNYHGHEFNRRAYYYHGREYNRYYRGYYYRGAYVNVYAPGFYYAPAFYGWAYNPWAVPVNYGWGWGGNPWYGYYGFYFNPYPVYAAPAFWLTDYLVATELQAAFAARAAAAAEAEVIPPSLYMCEGAGCGTLARDGQHFSGTLSDGTEIHLTVVKWDSQSVLLTRNGAAAGETVAYSGTILTPTMMVGTATGVENGQQVSRAWTASVNAPVLIASSGDAFFGAAAGSSPIMTPEIKQMVSDEVKGEIALENSEAAQNSKSQDADPASSGIERLMSDGKPHVFVAGDSLDVVDDGGNECALSDGDVLQLASAPHEDSTDAKLVVLAAKGDKECAKQATVTVAVTDLQEMQNHLRETIDQGLQELKDKQGTGGLPAAPPSAKAAPVETGLAKDAPPPEKDGEQAVNEQLSEADKAEQQTSAEAAKESGGSTDTAQAGAPAAPSQATPVSIEVGQTIDQVTSALGQPLTVINLGTKKIYKYKDMKITFRAGKVSDVE